MLNLLLPPAKSTVEVLEEAAEAVRSLGEGLFLPIYADSGTGKTTLADKQLNAAFGLAIEASMTFAGVDQPVVRSEKSLDFLPGLIPDTSVSSEERIRCLEFTYRKGDFLQSKNRSTIAQYCLTKLKNYARGVGWLSATD